MIEFKQNKEGAFYIYAETTDTLIIHVTLLPMNVVIKSFTSQQLQTIDKKIATPNKSTYHEK